MSGNDREDEQEPPSTRPGGRRLPDRLLVAFHAACDQGELDTAFQLLGALEDLVRRRGAAADPNRRRTIEGLVAGHERLWHLRHSAGDGW